MLRDFELEDLCMDFLSSEHPVMAGSTMLILGTGVVGTGLVQRVLKRFPETSVTWCYHRNQPVLPREWGARVELRPLTDVEAALSGATTVLCATGSDRYVISAEHAGHLPRDEKVTFVDLSMPRNVSPALDAPGRGVHVVDLDDLKHWYRREAADMDRIMQQAKEIVADHREMYDKLTSSFQGGNAQ